MIDEIPGEEFREAFGSVDIKIRIERNFFQCLGPVALQLMHFCEDLTDPAVPQGEQCLNVIPFGKIVKNLNGPLIVKCLFDSSKFFF